ncbi:hypothetical protein ACEPPZ_17915 [Paracoccus yeei]|uniref:hypothetical protein n=1 Tax=Paracoccus yeei TaxID=147645 RepID=UPI0037D67C1D
MQPAEIKRGATFKVDLKFEDADEWAMVFPHDSVVAAVKFGHRRGVVAKLCVPGDSRSGAGRVSVSA